MPSSPSRATQPPWTCRPSGRGAFYGNPHVPKDSGVAESSSSQRQENATQNKGSKTEGLPRNVPHARNGSSKLRCKAWVFGPALSLLGLLEALLLKGDGEDKQLRQSRPSYPWVRLARRMLPRGGSALNALTEQAPLCYIIRAMLGQPCFSNSKVFHCNIISLDFNSYQPENSPPRKEQQKLNYPKVNRRILIVLLS